MRRESSPMIQWAQRLCLCLCLLSPWPLATALGQIPPPPPRPPVPQPGAQPGGPTAVPPLPPRAVPTQPSIPASSPAAVPPRTPAPAATVAGITVENDMLSVQLQDQDLQSVIKTITTKGQIEVKHLEGLPNKRVSVTFTDVPIVVGLKRLLRVADIAGYVLMTGKEGDANKIQRLVFLPTEDGAPGVRSAQQQRPGAAPPRPTPPTPPQKPPQEEGQPPAQAPTQTSVFEDLKTNTAAKRLVSQLMHPNEQVRERAFESLVRLVGEDEKQRDLLEFLEPLMEDLSAEDKSTQEEAREELRKLLSQ